MTTPYLRGQSPYVSGIGRTPKIPLPSRNVDDWVFVTLTGIDVTSSLPTSAPGLPSGYILFEGAFNVGSFQLRAYKRIIAANEPDFQITVGSSAYWYGQIETYAGLSYRDPGYLDLPGGAGNYVTSARTAITIGTTIDLVARVSLDALGVEHRIFSWGSNDLGFGINSSNRPYFFVNNTLGNPIGNVAANADIPGLQANQKVWVWAHLEVATGNISYYYSYTDVEWAHSPRYAQFGTTVAGTNGGTTPRVSNSGTIYYGTNPSAGTPAAMNIYSLYEAAPPNRLNSVFSNPTTSTMVGTAIQRIPTSGNSSPIEGFDFYVAPSGSTSYTAPVTVYGGSNRLVIAKWEGGTDHADAVQVTPALGPATGWEKKSERQTRVVNLSFKEVDYTQLHDTGISTITADILGAAATTYDWWVSMIVLRPAETPALPPVSPQPPRVTLGCADSYSVWFTDDTYETRIDSAKWSNITWERSIDEISSATASFPDDLGGVRCLARLGGLEPWRYGLLIERNDAEVWRGPVTTVRRTATGIDVGANDVFARYQKRLAIRGTLATYTNTDAATLFRDIITTHATSPLDKWSLPVPVVNTGVVLSRQLKPREFKYAWDLLSELLGSSVDAYIMNGRLYVFQPGVGWRYHETIDWTLDGPYNSVFDFVYGTFTEESFQTRPTWTLDGAGQGNAVIVPSPDTGEYGFRTYEEADDPTSQATYGLLDLVDPNPIEIPDDTPPDVIEETLAARAASLLALRSTPPFTIEGGVLSQAAPVSVEHLRPGSIWKLDVFDDGYGQLLTLARLRRVTTTVSRTATGVDEKIAPVLEPVGSAG